MPLRMRVHDREPIGLALRRLRGGLVAGIGRGADQTDIKLVMDYFR
jgi:hypothetical protein